MNTLFNDVIRCSPASQTRISHPYTTYERGAFLQTASFSGVHEPQVEGRLHGHFGIYGSVLNPELFTRVAAGPKFLQDKLANILDSITTTHLSPNVRNWWEDCRSKKSNRTNASCC